MPKEYISTDYNRRKAEQHGGDETVIRVGWDKTGEYAQLATVRRSNIDGIPPTVDPDELSGGALDEGWFIDLDRKSINELIRVLRKARDQAFGEDA